MICPPGLVRNRQASRRPAVGLETLDREALGGTLPLVRHRGIPLRGLKLALETQKFPIRKREVARRPAEGFETSEAEPYWHQPRA